MLTYLRERKLPTLDEVAQSADLFLTAHKSQLSDSMKPVAFNSQSKTTVATDTVCDVRAEVQDGLLQLASGKQVPAMVDCGACGGKESVEDLNLPVVKSLVGDKTANVLRDTN